MQNFGRYVPSNYIAPNQPLQVTTGVNWGYIRIINNSPQMLSLNFAGQGAIDFPEFFLEDIPITPSYRGSITVQAVNNITNISSGTSNLLTINAYYPTEIQHPQSQPLNAPAVNATASGKPIFSATIGFGSTASGFQLLNVFNPPGSGVNMTFYAGRAFTSDTTLPIVELIYKLGADLNLPTAVSAVSHTGEANAPVSFAHCTAADSATGWSLAGNPVIEIMDLQAQVTQDFLTFPDNVTLTPGANLTIVLVQSGTGTTGKVVRLTMKWTEDIATPAQGGIPTSVATSVIQDGQPVAPIVEATPVGSPQTVLLTTDGNLTLAGLLSIGTPTTVNGSISGTLTYSFPIWGNGLKVCLITMQGFNGTVVTVNFPSVLARSWFWVGGLGGGTQSVQPRLGAATVNARIVTALAVAGGSFASALPIHQGSIGQIEASIDNLQVTVGGVTETAIWFVGM